MDFKERVYEAVRKIPKGRVATYGMIAMLAGSPNAARAVGNALHANPDGEMIPCFRVVNAQGRLAEDFVFGGKNEQKRRLEAEGIKVSADGFVDLKKYCWKL